MVKNLVCYAIMQVEDISRFWPKKGLGCHYLSHGDDTGPQEHHEALITPVATAGWSLNPSSVSLDEVHHFWI